MKKAKAACSSKNALIALGALTEVVLKTGEGALASAQHLAHHTAMPARAGAIPATVDSKDVLPPGSAEDATVALVHAVLGDLYRLNRQIIALAWSPWCMAMVAGSSASIGTLAGLMAAQGRYFDVARQSGEAALPWWQMVAPAGQQGLQPLLGHSVTNTGRSQHPPSAGVLKTIDSGSA